MTHRFGIVREFDFEAALQLDDLPTLTAKICFVRADGEDFIELKTIGPVDESYHEDDLQVIRLSKSAIDDIVTHFRLFTQDA